jgi:hypothetical protein
MRRGWTLLPMSLLLLLLSVSTVLAQLTCPQLVEQALAAVDQNCAGIGRNEACYGYNRVEASFSAEIVEGFFSQPADLASVVDLQTIRTAPLDLANDQWGVAVMSLQANMPNTLPGQNVTFILIGDTEVENAVAAEDRFTPSDGVQVTVTYPQGAALRSGPGDNFNVIFPVTAGTQLSADGLSADGAWVRTAYNDRPVWARRTTLADDPAIATLPTLTDELRTPMQAFYLRTGIGQPACEEVPDDILLVQGPEDIEIELTVNGANVSLGSSGAFRVVDVNGQPFLEVVVFDGEFIIEGKDGAPDTVVTPGQRSLMCLGDQNSRGLDGQANDLIVTCEPSAPEKIDVSEFTGDWCVLEDVPSSILNYGLNTCPGTHTVESGENLFRIAQYYCVSLEDLMTLNGITDPTSLTVGQQLILPPGACEGQGSTRPPTPVPGTQPTPLPTAQPTPIPDTQPTSVPQSTDVNCTTFAVIGPVSDITPRPTVFSWTEALGATEYEIVFYNYLNEFAQSFRVQATFIELNVGQIPTGSELSWEVRAYRNGQFACVTARTPKTTRLADPLAPTFTPVPSQTPVQPFNVSAICKTSSDVGIEWVNLPDGVTLVISWVGYPSGTSSILSGATGILATGSYYIDSATVSLSNGSSYTIGSLGCSAP